MNLLRRRPSKSAPKSVTNMSLCDYPLKNGKKCGRRVPFPWCMCRRHRDAPGAAELVKKRRAAWVERESARHNAEEARRLFCLNARLHGLDHEFVRDLHARWCALEDECDRILGRATKPAERA